MQELLAHLLEREGAIEHFYCDHRGLVTIAIGFLVDADGAPEATLAQVVRKFASRPDIKFSARSGAVASAEEIEADWRRVKELGRKNPTLGARQYAQVAELAIDRATIDAITSTKIGTFLDDLYERRPFVLGLDARVAMALVDVRYNPAGVPLYGNDPQVQQMWGSLNAADPQFNPSRAVELFEQIWAGRGVPRYQERHKHRLDWMRAGLLS